MKINCERVLLFLSVLIFVSISGQLYAQTDSLRNQILEYEDSKEILISKGRKLLLIKFLEADYTKVKEIKDYLVKIENEDYFAFYPIEYWTLLLWTKEYKELSRSILKYDSLKAMSYDNKIAPANDLLSIKLIDKTLEKEEMLKQQIASSELDKETKQFLSLYLNWILLEKRVGQAAQDSLNKQSDEFNGLYMQNKYKPFIRKYIKYKIVPSDWGLTFEFFSGYGLMTGNLSNRYNNNFPFGVAFDLCYKKYELHFRNYIGVTSTKQDRPYSTGIWKKGSRELLYIPEVSLGYAVYNSDKYKFTPFLGIAGTSFSPTTIKLDQTPELEELVLDFTTTYVMGLTFDLKFKQLMNNSRWTQSSYGFMRVRYGFCLPQFQNKYAGLSGTMHYITIGFGGLSRNSKREY
jgi:hypothetical protein